MEADYETPDGQFLCAKHADRDAEQHQARHVRDFNAQHNCDEDGYPFDGGDTPDGVYRWTDGEVCQQCE